MRVFLIIATIILLLFSCYIICGHLFKSEFELANACVVFNKGEPELSLTFKNHDTSPVFFEHKKNAYNAKISSSIAVQIQSIPPSCRIYTKDFSGDFTVPPDSFFIKNYPLSINEYHKIDTNPFLGRNPLFLVLTYPQVRTKWSDVDYWCNQAFIFGENYQYCMISDNNKDISFYDTPEKIEYFVQSKQKTYVITSPEKLKRVKDFLKETIIFVFKPYNHQGDNTSDTLKFFDHENKLFYEIDLFPFVFNYADFNAKTYDQFIQLLEKE